MTVLAKKGGSSHATSLFFLKQPFILLHPQFFIKGGFHKFDFGDDSNKQIYGQKDPPQYDPAKITCPTITYWSDNDWLASPIVSLAIVNSLKQTTTIT